MTEKNVLKSRLEKLTQRLDHMVPDNATVTKKRGRLRGAIKRKLIKLAPSTTLPSRRRVRRVRGN